MNEIANYKMLIAQRRSLLLPVVTPLGELAGQETRRLEDMALHLAAQKQEAAALAFRVYGEGYVRIIAAELAAYEQELGRIRGELEKRGR